MTLVDLAVTPIVVAGCLFWIVGSVLGVLTIRRVRHLARLEAPLPQTPARVSVIVPCRNERAALEAATRARLASDYPNLEIVLVDDRSDDGTGELADALAREDARVRAVHIDHLPDGWLGKVYAIDRGVAAATGSWLLLTDADVHFSPTAVSRAVVWAHARGLDHLVVLPEITGHGFLLDAAYSTFGRYFALSQRLWAIEDPRSSASVGVGAFNLVRRSALDRSPGFAWLKMEVGDDVALGLMLKRSGARAAVAHGADHVSLSWYANVAEMARGLEKNTFAFLGCSLPRVIAAVATMLALDVSPIVALAPVWPSMVTLLGALALAAGLTTALLAARWARRGVVAALVYPVGTLLFAGILLRAGVLGAWRGGVYWRGRFHSVDELRAGSRVGASSRRNGTA
jgi:cellulose synthase/poly-beta-1,6-N-acetylglucosamine synthase-like glycosyltransferase